MRIKKLFINILILLMIFTFTNPYVFAVKKQQLNENDKFTYINIEWWKELNDDILIDYIIKAINCNQDLKIATLQVQESTENKNIKRAKEYPSIGISAVPALYKLPGITNSDGLISLPAYANYELDLFGKNRDKTKSMDKLIEISKFKEKSAYISVASAVGCVYYNIVKLDKLIELQEKIIINRKKIYDLMKISNDEGLISTSDTINAEKAYIQASTDIFELQKTRERMLNMLAVLIGESPENSSCFNRISYDDLVINKTIPEYIPSEIIQSRPDYLSAEKMIEKTGLDVRAAKKDFLPSFNILGLISFNSTEFLSKMNWTNSVALLGANAMLPLFTGGAKVANLKLQKNKYEQALQNYAKINLTSIQEVNDSLSELKLDNDKYIQTIKSYETDKKDFYYANLKYNEGIISNLDLLQKRENLLSSEKNLTKYKTDYYINQINLYKTTAGGL